MNENSNYCIYMHMNKINGKVYFGQTSHGEDPNIRWHYGNGYRGCTYFYNAIQKYGWDGFWHVVLKDHLTLDEANTYEEELIKNYETQDHDIGYNLNFGGDNHKVTEETRRKMSEAQIGEKNGFYGKQHSEETRKKMRENHSDFSGKNHPQYGTHRSQETKKKLSEAKKGKLTGANSPHAKRVYCVELDKIYLCIKDASQELNIDASNLIKACKGKKQTAGGYHWKYADEQ